MYFQKVIPETFMNVNFIHPLKQKVVKELIDYVVEKYPYIFAVVVFGSSVTPYCNIYSDVDIVIWGDEEMKFIPPDNDIYDVLFRQRIRDDSPLFQDIRKEGVVVYCADFV